MHGLPTVLSSPRSDKIKTVTEGQRNGTEPPDIAAAELFDNWVTLLLMERARPHLSVDKPLKLNNGNEISTLAKIAISPINTHRQGVSNI